jgi:hypothetical protein
MKTATFGTLLIASLFAFGACKKSDLRSETTANAIQESAHLDPGSGTWIGASAYDVILESKMANVDGTWTWTWSIRNPNPGNGNNGTVQALSHWNMTFGSCISFSDIVSASTSYNGTSFSSFSPSLAVDPSQVCVVLPVLKFNVTTNGNAKTYCRLVVKSDYSVDNTAVGFYKSGSRTGCGPMWFQGIGCNSGGFDN